MNEYEATIQINPTDDIKFILEESGCYESEIEMMKAGGTYDAFATTDVFVNPRKGIPFVQCSTENQLSDFRRADSHE